MDNKNPAHLILGKNGEQVAEAILIESGCKILAKNWRFGKLELDIVGEKEGEIIFVEVKTRATAVYGGGIGAITPAKKRRLVKAALAWLSQNNAWDRPCRFDVICLTGKDTFSLEYFYSAIDLAGAFNNRDSSGQYW